VNPFLLNFWWKRTRKKGGKEKGRGETFPSKIITGNSKKKGWKGKEKRGSWNI